MIHFQVSIGNAAELLASQAYGAGAVIRWETSLTEMGSFVEGGTVALVAGTSLYDVWDSGGTPGVTWFRTRVSDAAASTFSAYSAKIQDGVPTTYASLVDLLAVFETRPVQSAKLARLGQLLAVATSQVIEACGHRDYFRHPSTGSATWIADGNGGDTLHIHEGLISLDTLELSFDGGLTYVPVTATDYMLRGDSPYSAEPIPTNEPYFHVRFTGWGQYTNFPPTVRSARLTGVRSWPAIPVPLVEGTVQRARQLAYAEGSYSGANAGGPDEYGHVATTDRFWPQSMWNFLKLERQRFMGCHIGGTMTESVPARSYR